MNYGFSYFLTAVEVYTESEIEQLKNMALACRVAFGADKQDFKRFMKTKAR